MRRTKLTLLVMAVGVTAMTALSLWLGAGRIQAVFVTSVLMPGGLYVLAHLGVRLWAPWADPLLLPPGRRWLVQQEVAPVQGPPV